MTLPVRENWLSAHAFPTDLGRDYRRTWVASISFTNVGIEPACDHMPRWAPVCHLPSAIDDWPFAPTPPRLLDAHPPAGIMTAWLRWKCARATTNCPSVRRSPL